MRVCFCVKQMFDTDQTFLMDPFSFLKAKTLQKRPKVISFSCGTTKQYLHLLNLECLGGLLRIKIIKDTFIELSTILKAATCSHKEQRHKDQKDNHE